MAEQVPHGHRLWLSHHRERRKVLADRGQSAAAAMRQLYVVDPELAEKLTERLPSGHTPECETSLAF
ncbi:hypothetical protein [Nonomuraea sp. 10N515B]|uniref:hypothetical protein n=1 Tax=Nonomuraea sp. 10N515B TaxID=3457422 RepID=UPI003FCD30A6